MFDFDLNQWLLLQSDTTVYIVLFSLLLTGAMGFPPEDFTLVLAGILLHQGKGELNAVIGLCYVGTLLGDFFIYGIGRWFGKTLFSKKWFQKRVRPGRIKVIRSGLEKRRYWMIFVARHLFYLRTMTFITCGAVKMKFYKFALADCLSATVSVPLMLFLGFQASEHYDTIVRFLAQAKLLSLLLILVAIFTTLYIFYKRKREAEEKEAAEPESTGDSGQGMS